MTRFLRRLCLATDIEDYSRHRNLEQLDAQRRLARIVTFACLRARVVRVERQEQGDGQLVVLRAGIDETYVVPALILGLRQALYESNRDSGDFGRIRLRAALAQGPLTAGASGYVGKAVVTVSRLLDSAPLRSALTDNADIELALAVTDDLYADVLSENYPGLAASEFTRTDISVPAKSFSTSAWLHRPAAGPAPDLRALDVEWSQVAAGGAVATSGVAAIATGVARSVAAGALASAAGATAPALGAVSASLVVSTEIHVGGPDPGHPDPAHNDPGHTDAAHDPTHHDPGLADHANYADHTHYEVTIGVTVYGDHPPDVYHPGDATHDDPAGHHQHHDSYDHHYSDGHDHGWSAGHHH